MSKNGAKIGLKQGQWCKQVESKTVKIIYWQLGTWLLTSSTWKRGHLFFLKTTRPFSTDIFSTDLNFGHTCKFIPPPWYNGVGGGLMEPLPRGFDMLQYFKVILPSVESLWSAQQDEVYFLGGGAAGGLWHHQQWLPSWILPRIRNLVKTARNGNFCVWHVN